MARRRQHVTHASGRKRSIADRDGVLARLFLLPAVVYIVLLVALPFLLAIGFAFSDVTAGDPSFDWVGLDNFCKTRSSSPPSRWS
jgi:multiple sugar transport system permease protein